MSKNRFHRASIGLKTTLVVAAILIHQSICAQQATGTSNQAPLPVPSGSSGVSQSASQGRASQLLGLGMNAAAGAMFMGPCTNHHYSACVLAALSFAQAAMMGSAAGKSGRTYNASTGTTSIDGSSYLPTDDWTKNLTPEQLADVNKLDSLGYHLNKNGTITDPSGKVLSSSDFTSPSAMESAGIPASAIASTQSLISKVNKAAAEQAQAALADNAPHVVSMGVDGSGGGRSPSSVDSADSSSSLDAYLKRLRNPFGLSGDQKQQLLAGKSVSHGDDVIGVSVDDIFKMVHRRYQEKRASDQFNEPALAGAMPAKK